MNRETSEMFLRGRKRIERQAEDRRRNVREAKATVDAAFDCVEYLRGLCGSSQFVEYFPMTTHVAREVVARYDATLSPGPSETAMVAAEEATPTRETGPGENQEEAMKGVHAGPDYPSEPITEEKP